MIKNDLKNMFHAIEAMLEGQNGMGTLHSVTLQRVPSRREANGEYGPTRLAVTAKVTVRETVEL